MKLKYKITLIITLVGIFIISSISSIYSYWSYQEIIDDEKTRLIAQAKDTSHIIDLKLYEKLSIAKTLASAPIIYQTLTQSNTEYQLLTKNQRTKKSILSMKNGNYQKM